MQTAQGALALMRMGSGETLANASVLMDAHRMVGPLMLIEFERRGVKCDASNFLLGEIKVTERGDDLGEEIFGARLKGSWTETWEFTGCGMRGSVPIEFRWDGAGGAYINGRMKEAVIEKL